MLFSFYNAFAGLRKEGGGELLQHPPHECMRLHLLVPDQMVHRFVLINIYNNSLFK